VAWEFRDGYPKGRASGMPYGQPPDYADDPLRII
jgi:hypothetical protein